MAFNPSVPKGDDYAHVAAAVAAAIRDQDLRRAYDLASWAMGRGMVGRIILNARGLGYQASGRHYEAIEDFRQALTFAPNDAAIHNAMGMSYLALERPKKAMESFDAAIATTPDSAMTHCRRARALSMHGDHDGARLAYNRAIELDPMLVDALANLASQAARAGRLEEARTFAERALARDPGNATANFALALVAMREKRFEDAEGTLNSVLDNPVLRVEARIQMLGTIGDALDGQKRYGDAFMAYRKRNEIAYRTHAARFEGMRGSDTIRHTTTYFEEASPESWKVPDAGEDRPDGPREQVFLLGFMRSGTTLLEQVLASNPDIVALEEKGLLNELSQSYMSGRAELDNLAAIQGDALAQARRSYWEQAARVGGDLKGKVFVDKQPLNTVKLPLIAKLFPKAKVLYALRDPRDVVFSCYRRQFRITSAMVEFLNLTDAANFYAGIMELGEIYRRLLPLNLLEHRYEDMVVDFEGRVRAVCDFIGIEWADSMRDFDKNAPKPDLRSPSASQVQRPLYAEGVAQWRNYENELAPVLPILAPLVKRFGYPQS